MQQKIVIQTPENGKQFTPIQPHKIQICSRRQQSSAIQTNLSKTKFKRRVQIFKKNWKIVAAATIGDYLVNRDL